MGRQRPPVEGQFEDEKLQRLGFGPGIEQDRLSRVFAENEAIDRALVQRVLRAAHQTADSDMTPVLAGVTSLLSGSREDTFADWMQFTAGTVTYPAIEAALRSAEHAAWMLASRSPQKDTL